MIALPFAQPGPLDYRLLLNQYDEELNFTLVDKAVPNRGVTANHNQQTDQFIVTLDYEQVVKQVAVVDEPASTVTGLPGNAIHHEPGLFLNMLNRIPDGFDIARLATIPHGDAVLALGKSSRRERAAADPGGRRAADRGEPGPGTTRTSRRTSTSTTTRSRATSAFPGFPGFDPTAPHLLLQPPTTGSPSPGRRCWTWTPPTRPAGSRTSRSWSSRPTPPR